LLRVVDHAAPNQLDYFFTIRKPGTRGDGGGVRDLCFHGNSMLKWGVYLDTWRDATFENLHAYDVHAGVLDACSNSTEYPGESILLRRVDIGATTGECSTRYGARFRAGSTISTTWTDCVIDYLFVVNCWDTGVLVDGCERFAVTNIVAAQNAGLSDSIDSAAHAGCLHAVHLANTIDNPGWTTNAGFHVVGNVYHESLTGSETPSTHQAVLIDVGAGNNGGNKYNTVSNVCVANNNSAHLALADANNAGRTAHNTFSSGARSFYDPVILVGSSVVDTEIRLSAGTPAITDAGVGTTLNGAILTP
jgi:hypothetical protein